MVGNGDIGPGGNIQMILDVNYIQKFVGEESGLPINDIAIFDRYKSKLKKKKKKVI